MLQREDGWHIHNPSLAGHQGHQISIADFTFLVRQQLELLERLVQFFRFKVIAQLFQSRSQARSSAQFAQYHLI